MASPPNPAAVLVVNFEYLFCLPSSERPRPPAQRKARELLWGSCTLVPWAADYGPTNLDTTMFPPAENGWGTKYPIWFMVPLLLGEGEGPPT
jgi:hypothetical protein